MCILLLRLFAQRATEVSYYSAYFFFCAVITNTGTVVIELLRYLVSPSDDDEIGIDFIYNHFGYLK